MVNIHVGSSPTQHYKLHKTLLRKKLHYFATVFPEEEEEEEEEEQESTSSTTDTNTIYMPDIPAGAFDLLVRWVYGGDDAIAIQRPATHSELRGVTDGAVRDTIQLYGVAEKLADEDLMDAAMSALFPIYRSVGYPSHEEIRLAYGVSGKGSLLRRFMAGGFVWRLVFGGEWRGRYVRGMERERDEGRSETSRDSTTTTTTADEILPGDDKHQHHHQTTTTCTCTCTYSSSPPSTDNDNHNHNHGPPNPPINPATTPADPNSEWLLPASSFQALATSIPDLATDMFVWLYDFSLNPVPPADRGVCEYHRHGRDVDEGGEGRGCEAGRMFPPAGEDGGEGRGRGKRRPGLYPRVRVGWGGGV